MRLNGDKPGGDGDDRGDDFVGRCVAREDGARTLVVRRNLVPPNCAWIVDQNDARSLHRLELQLALLDDDVGFERSDHVRQFRRRRFSDDRDARIAVQNGRQSGASEGRTRTHDGPNHARTMRLPRKALTAPLGTASAKPPAIMLLTPTTRPAASASGPPEFPGASLTSATTHLALQRCTRPALSAPTRPSGLPTASTSSPGRNSAASRVVTGSRPVSASSICSAARSREGSRLQSLARKRRPSCVSTRGDGPRRTCAFVMTRPLPGQTIPEPDP